MPRLVGGLARCGRSAPRSARRGRRGPAGRRAGAGTQRPPRPGGRPRRWPPAPSAPPRAAGDGIGTASDGRRRPAATAAAIRPAPAAPRRRGWRRRAGRGRPRPPATTGRAPGAAAPAGVGGAHDQGLADADRAQARRRAAVPPAPGHDGQTGPTPTVSASRGGDRPADGRTRPPAALWTSTSRGESPRRGTRPTSAGARSAGRPAGPGERRRRVPPAQVGPAGRPAAGRHRRRRRRGRIRVTRLRRIDADGVRRTTPASGAVRVDDQQRRPARPSAPGRGPGRPGTATASRRPTSVRPPTAPITVPPASRVTSCTGRPCARAWRATPAARPAAALGRLARPPGPRSATTTMVGPAHRIELAHHQLAAAGGERPVDQAGVVAGLVRPGAPEQLGVGAAARPSHRVGRRRGRAAVRGRRRGAGGADEDGGGQGDEHGALDAHQPQRGGVQQAHVQRA